MGSCASNRAVARRWIATGCAPGGVGWRRSSWSGFSTTRSCVARAADQQPDDLVATLVAFTAEAVRRACDQHLAGVGAVDRLLVGGGGARNPALMEALAAAFPGLPVAPFDAAGVPAQAAEAMAFALMGRNALLGLPNHLPRCTGARRAAVLGEIVPGRSGRIAG
jgi:anhydro-N-acetylmuramic acid kinase